MKDFMLQNGEKIVFMGDSVTDAGRKRPLGEGLWDGAGNGFVRQIDNFINVFYPDRVVSVINMGTSGNTSRDLLGRFDNDAIALKPDYIVICIGFNDVWRFFDEPAVGSGVSLDEYVANLGAMLDKCEAAGVRTILMTPYYMEINKADRMRATMDEYGAAMKKIAAERGLPCLDLQAAFDKLLAYKYPAQISWDRVHPNHIGSLLIADEFLKYAGFDFGRLV